VYLYNLYCITFTVEDEYGGVRQQIVEELNSVCDKFKEIGDELGIKYDKMKQLKKIHGYDYCEGLKAVIEQYLIQNYNVTKRGHPDWVKLVRAVSSSTGGNNHTLAQNLAFKHKSELQDYIGFVSWLLFIQG